VAFIINLQSTASIFNSQFVNNRAAIYLASDGRFVSSDIRVSFTSLRTAGLGSAVSSLLRLERVTFSGSGQWDLKTKYDGGGDVSAYDQTMVYSDKALVFPHECGTEVCDDGEGETPSLPLGCPANGFLLQGNDWLALAMQVRR
jgi:hypothetical protein